MALAVPRESRHRTKQQFVYRALRDAILKCELPPGERLVIDEVAHQFEVSIIPVREALQLLQSEGLVQNVPHVGATVAPISRDSIREVFTLLEGLEVVGTRTAAVRATSDDFEALAGVVKAMDRALAEGSHEQWAELNRRFHLTITRITGMPMLEDMMMRVLDRWDRVRRFYFKGVLIHRAEQAQQEHHALLDTMMGRELLKLEATIRQHNQGALAAYTSYVETGARSPS